jgi:hypothetical protein
VIFDTLSQDDRGKFLTMAALGGQPDAFFVDSILRHLLEINDPRTIPAFKKWADIPNPESHSIQDAVDTFLWAIVGLARYTDLPRVTNRPLRDDEAVWQSFGEILFWLHKPAVPENVMKKNCSPCWERLLSGYIHAAIDPLMLIVRQIGYAAGIDKGFLKDIVNAFPLEIRTILEKGLKIRSNLTSLFRNNPWTKQEHGKFIIEMLSRIGNETTVPLLEPLLDLPEIGAAVASAIRSIRSRKVD